MIYLLRYILGFVKIKVNGIEAEKFLNITAVNKIKLWDLKYRKNSIEGYISVQNFKKIRNIVRGSNFKIHIITC